MDATVERRVPVDKGWKIAFFLVARDGSKARELTTAAGAAIGRMARQLGATASEIVPALVPGVASRVSPAEAAPGDAVGDNAHRLNIGMSNGRGDVDLSAAVMLAARPDEASMSQAVTRFAESLAPLVAADQSTIVVARVMLMDPGRVALRVMYCLRRQADVAHDEAIKKWQEQVGPNLFTHPSRVGYEQLQGDVALTTAAMAAAGYRGGDYDGVAVEWFRIPMDTLPSGPWSFSSASAALGDEPEPNGIAVMLNRYFEMMASKTLFGVEPNPTMK